MEDGSLDTSLDGNGRMHGLEHDMLWKMANENREGGNKMVASGQHEQAIGRYSEVIMQLRSLEQETDVKWDDDARFKVKELRALSYLNLSMCFLKMEQWEHAINTSTRAIVGDKNVPDPKDNVLPKDKKAKALFRRATAHCEGFGSFDKALDDLREAAKFAPEDKAVAQMLKKCEFAVKKTTKAADKKMAGFLQKEAASGEGLFDESLRPKPELEKPKPTPDVVKLTDGLWIAPEETKEVEEKERGEVDVEELGREIAEMKEENPELFAQLQTQVKDFVSKNLDELEAGEKPAGDGEEAASVQEGQAAAGGSDAQASA